MIKDVKVDELIIGKVKPIIIYPKCILETGRQGNCLDCDIKEECNSPKSWCIKTYYNHPKGCPNYGKVIGCPPNNLMFEDIYNLSKDVYILATGHSLKEYYNRIMRDHPLYTEAQRTNILPWKRAVENFNRQEVLKFIGDNKDLIASYDGEALGVNLIETCKQIGIILKFAYPISDYTYRIAMIGTLKNHEQIESYGYEIKNKVLVKTSCR